MKTAGSVPLAAVMLVCGLAAFIGLAPMRLFEHDVFFSLDNAYRVLEGQVPHRDFSSAWGPVIYLIQATGLRLSGMRPAGIGYANALFGALLAAWTYAIARRRLSSALAGALSIYTVLLIAAPFALGFNPLALSHAMAYNRYGFALFGILLVECFAPSGAKRDRSGAFSTGAAWALLAFLKLSYAAVAVPFLVASLIWGADRKRRLAGLCGGGALVATLLLCYLRFDVADMLRDLAYAASGRGRTWKPGEFLNAVFFLESVPFVLLAALAGGGGRAARFHAGLLAGLTLAAGGILLSTNHQPEGLPLNGYAAAALAGAALARLKTARSAGPRKLVIVFLMGLCAAPLSVENAVALGAAALQRLRPPGEAAARVEGARGALMTFGPVASPLTTETGGAAYVAALNDGMELIRRHTTSRDGVLTMDMLNPFNYLLDRPSPRGGMAAAAYNYTFSDTAHPSADRFFGEARYVLARKYSKSAGDYGIENYHIQGTERVYGPALRQRFSVVEETAHWSLWRR